MKTAEFFRQIEQIYKWNLADGEKNRLYYLAREIGAGLTIDNFKIYYSQFPEGNIKEFVEWYQGG